MSSATAMSDTAPPRFGSFLGSAEITGGPRHVSYLLVDSNYGMEVLAAGGLLRVVNGGAAVEMPGVAQGPAGDPADAERRRFSAHCGEQEGGDRDLVAVGPSWMALGDVGNGCDRAFRAREFRV